MDRATRDYLVRQQNPYAKLSVLGEGDSDPLWKHKTEVYDFVATTYGIGHLRSKPSALLREIAGKVVKMDAASQSALRQRITSSTAGVRFAHNRLAPAEVNRILAAIGAMVDDVLP